MKKLILKILSIILRILARLTIDRYKPMIIGVTGNVGKTSTKEAIKTVLQTEKKVRAASKNFNNEIGLPLVILGDWKSTEGLFFWPWALFLAFLQVIFKNKNYPEILILEYGIDRPGDMTKMLDIARPHIGVVTAIGDIPVHVEFFPSAESLAREKEKIVNHLPATGFAVLNADDKSVLEMSTKTRAQVVTYGFAKNADVRVTNFEEVSDFKPGVPFDESVAISFKLNYGGSFLPVRMPGVLGESQAYAALAASSIGLVLGMNLVQIGEAMMRHKTPVGRLKILEGVKHSIIIDDTYNASPLSMSEALATISRLNAKRKIAVLGDMLELGKYTLEAHEFVGRSVRKSVDILITVGVRAKAIAEAAIGAGLTKKSVFEFNTTKEAGAYLQHLLREGDLVLVKASQGVRLEKVTECVLAHPENAEKLLPRQTPYWKKHQGLYD